MNKTTVWEFTEEELRVLQDAMFAYEQLLCGVVMDLDWNPKGYEVAAELHNSFCSEVDR